ncbi:MAG: hypothetical protein OXG37_02270, partial [Actinomycetia bacterium]|nr:hypothetical protein [Actinomycetes bacterium]
MTTVTTPYPGTFYRRPRPDAEPYVSEGQRISAGQVIGLVEVMKNFFEVVTCPWCLCGGLCWWGGVSL